MLIVSNTMPFTNEMFKQKGHPYVVYNDQSLSFLHMGKYQEKNQTERIYYGEKKHNLGDYVVGLGYF